MDPFCATQIKITHTHLHPWVKARHKLVASQTFHAYCCCLIPQSSHGRHQASWANTSPQQSYLRTISNPIPKLPGAMIHSILETEVSCIICSSFIFMFPFPCFMSYHGMNPNYQICVQAIPPFPMPCYTTHHKPTHPQRYFGERWIRWRPMHPAATPLRFKHLFLCKCRSLPQDQVPLKPTAQNIPMALCCYRDSCTSMINTASAPCEGDVLRRNPNHMTPPHSTHPG